MPDHLQSLIKRHPNLVAQLRAGRLVLFAGAGLSRPVGLPGWWELTSPLAEELGIDPNGHSPIEVAQYYVNSNAQGRHLLLKRIVQALKTEPDLFSASHNLIKQLPVSLVVTTNYDRLFEHHFDKQPSVGYSTVISDAEVPYADASGKTLIKMNGCVSRPDSIIATRDDFGAIGSRDQRFAESLAASWRTIPSYFSDSVSAIRFSRSCTPKCLETSASAGLLAISSP